MKRVRTAPCHAPHVLAACAAVAAPPVGCAATSCAGTVSRGAPAAATTTAPRAWQQAAARTARRKTLMMRTRRKKKYRPTLRFSPYAWAKLLFLRDRGQTEIGGFGIAREGDPLLIEDVALVRQLCTAVTVKFDDLAVADFFDEQIDLGRRPEQFARVWIHTHPGDSPLPSLTD